jgi:hypothetical protein
MEVMMVAKLKEFDEMPGMRLLVAMTFFGLTIGSVLSTTLG